MFCKRLSWKCQIMFVLMGAGSVWAAGGDMGIGTEPLTNGSSAYPYRIEDVNDFEVFAADSSYWDKYTYLECDLDLTSSGTYGRAPIAGDMDIQFSGSFDGKNHIISNLTINGISYLGLFGRIDPNGIVTNLGINNANITGHDYVGGLCGYNSRGSIENCFSTGTVSGDAHVGGLCGGNGGAIINCFSTGIVSGRSVVGGLCGDNFGYCYFDVNSSFCYDGNIMSSYSTSFVTGSGFNIGGLCGLNEAGAIMNCYSTGEVSGGNYVGGLCGLFDTATIMNCYSTGEVSGGDRVGCLCGFDVGNGGIIKNSFWDYEHCGGGSYGGVGKTTQEMQTLSTFTNAEWDFYGETENGTVNIWFLPDGDYPKLTSQGCPFDVPADANGDCRVNLVDLAIMAESWMLDCFIPQACRE